MEQPCLLIILLDSLRSDSIDGLVVWQAIKVKFQRISKNQLHLYQNIMSSRSDSDSEPCHEIFETSFTSSASTSRFSPTLHIALSITYTSPHPQPNSLEIDSSYASSHFNPPSFNLSYAEQLQQQQQENSFLEYNEQRKSQYSDASSSFAEQDFDEQAGEWEMEEESVERESPFFTGVKQEGLQWEQIEAIPTMVWSHIHQKFNKGEKCSVCLQQYEVGGMLRVMPCLHRYHMHCLDEWLEMRGNCPNCRNGVNGL